MIDLDEFLKSLGIDVLSNISSFSNVRSELVQEDEIDFVYDNDGNVIEEISKVQAKSEESSIDFMPYGIGTFVTETNATGKADVVFVIDTTGSMGSPIANVKNNINIFADKLVKDYNVDTNFSLIEYRDIAVDGLRSTKQHKNLSSNWFRNVTTFKNKINTLSVTGGGDTLETPIDGLERARSLDWRGDSTKFVVLITDAGYKVNNSYGISSMEQMAQWFADDNIIVSAITANSSTYSSLTNATDGLYGYINGNFSTVLLELAKKLVM